jgi:hypothetical protein
VNPSPTNGEFILTKNPKFDIPTVAKGNVDQTIGMVSTNVNQMTENVINGSLDYMTEDPVGDLLPQVEANYKDRFLIGPGYPNNLLPPSMTGYTPISASRSSRRSCNTRAATSPPATTRTTCPVRRSPLQRTPR